MFRPWTAFPPAARRGGRRAGGVSLNRRLGDHRPGRQVRPMPGSLARRGACVMPRRVLVEPGACGYASETARSFRIRGVYPGFWACSI